MEIGWLDYLKDCVIYAVRVTGRLLFTNELMQENENGTYFLGGWPMRNFFSFA